jgi:hypothetical protein
MTNPSEDVFALELAEGGSDGMPASPEREMLPDIDSPRAQRTRVAPASDVDDFMEDRASIADFLRNFQSYAIMPQSSKVVVLDNRISVRAAIQALEENGMTA